MPAPTPTWGPVGSANRAEERGRVKWRSVAGLVLCLVAACDRHSGPLEAAKPAVSARRSLPVVARLVPAESTESRKLADALPAPQARVAERAPAVRVVARAERRTPEPTPADFGAWIEDLRDDDVRWNAEQAVTHLSRAWPASRTWLLGCLRSYDVQQRHLSASILIAKGEAPTYELTEVAVEALRNRVPGVRSSRSDDRPARTCGVRQAQSYLARHPDAARYYLERATDSDDVGQRLRSIELLARDEQVADKHWMVPQLLACLRDNDVYGDAAHAARILYQLGPEVLPHLDGAARSFDAQQAGIAGFLAELLRHPDPRAFDYGAAWERYELRGVLAARSFVR